MDILYENHDRLKTSYADVKNERDALKGQLAELALKNAGLQNELIERCEQYTEMAKKYMEIGKELNALGAYCKYLENQLGKGVDDVLNRAQAVVTGKAG